MGSPRQVIALEARLRNCRNVTTLGVRPNFSDYAPEEAALIRSAETVYYPTSFYAGLLDSAGIRTFPSYHAYKSAQDKIVQTALFQILRIPHPRTRVFYGKQQKAAITCHFAFPFIAKVPRGSALGRGVFLIRTPEDLTAYLGLNTVAYIQEYLPADRDMRVVVIGGRIVLGYWRIANPDEFRSNVSLGGQISLAPVPDEALALALATARQCRWDDVGIDIRMHQGRYYVIEANMKYGREGFRQAGIDYFNLMEEMIAHAII